MTYKVASHDGKAAQKSVRDEKLQGRVCCRPIQIIRTMKNKRGVMRLSNSAAPHQRIQPVHPDTLQESQGLRVRGQRVRGLRVRGKRVRGARRACELQCRALRGKAHAERRGREKVQLRVDSNRKSYSVTRPVH